MMDRRLWETFVSTLQDSWMVWNTYRTSFPHHQNHGRVALQHQQSLRSQSRWGNNSLSQSRFKISFMKTRIFFYLAHLTLVHYPTIGALGLSLLAASNAGEAGNHIYTVGQYRSYFMLDTKLKIKEHKNKKGDWTLSSVIRALNISLSLIKRAQLQL